MMSRTGRSLSVAGVMLLTAQAFAAAITPASDSASQWRIFLDNGAQFRPNQEFPYAHCFRRAAGNHGLPESVLLAVARGESNFDAGARSSAGAYGLMQIRWPLTARHLGIERLSQLLDPCVNVDAGARYLKELIKRYQGDLHYALAAYNYGPSRIPLHGDIPAKAAWYSAYILDHLRRVVGGSLKGAGPSKQGGTPGERMKRVIHFTRPYRAKAFVDSMRRRLNRVRLDWFRRPRGGFDVMLLYSDQREYRRGRDALRRWSIELPAAEAKVKQT